MDDLENGLKDREHLEIARDYQWINETNELIMIKEF